MPVCICTVSASVWEYQGHCELMQRDEAKFSPWNIYQHRLGNDISLTFTLVFSHKWQRGNVAGTRALNDVVWSTNIFALSSWSFLFILSDLTEEVQLREGRGGMLKITVNKIQLNFCCWTTRYLTTCEKMVWFIWSKDDWSASTLTFFSYFYRVFPFIAHRAKLPFKLNYDLLLTSNVWKGYF